MGLGGISIWQLLIVLAIVVVVFGTKRLKGLGGDLGGALKSFKTAMNDDSKTEAPADDPLSVAKGENVNRWAGIGMKDTDKTGH